MLEGEEGLGQEELQELQEQAVRQQPLASARLGLWEEGAAAALAALAALAELAVLQALQQALQQLQEAL